LSKLLSESEPPLDHYHAHIFILAAHLPQLEAGAAALAEVRLLYAGGEVQPEVPGDVR